MDYFLIISGILLILTGLAGSIVPVLPGPPLSYLGLILLHLTTKYSFSSNFLILWAALTIAVTVIDYLIPAWGTKKYGGSKRGIWGSIIGLILGIFFFPPLGIVIGPFIGAILGELSSGQDSTKAIRSGIGSFLGFIAGSLLKLIASATMGWYFFAKLI